VDHIAHAPAYRPVSLPVAEVPLPARLQRFYADLALEREARLDQLGELFTDDVEFIDPFRHTHGLAELRVLFERMFHQYRHIRFDGFVMAGTHEAFTLTYRMGMRMVVGPEFVTQMASVVVARDGRVSKLTDYYDFGSALLSPVAPLVSVYQQAMRRLFL